MKSTILFIIALLVIIPTQLGYSKGNESLINLKDPQSIKAHHPVLIAHRGGYVTDKAPENSIAAIELAAERGYTMLEVDVRYTKDGVIVCFHDNTMIQDVGISGVIEDFTFDELSKLRYKDTDERIITLDEYLERSTQYKMGIMLDIKAVDANRNEDKFFKGIADLIEKHGLTNSTVTISREPLAEKYLKGKALLRMSYEEFENIARGKMVNIKEKIWFDWPRFITDEMVELIHKKGCLIMPSINLFHYEVYPEQERVERAKKDINRMIKAGVDAFQIDGPYDEYFNRK